MERSYRTLSGINQGIGRSDMVGMGMRELEIRQVPKFRHINLLHSGTPISVQQIYGTKCRGRPISGVKSAARRIGGVKCAAGASAASNAPPGAFPA